MALFWLFVGLLVGALTMAYAAGLLRRKKEESLEDVTDEKIAEAARAGHKTTAMRWHRIKYKSGVKEAEKEIDQMMKNWRSP